MDGSVGHFLANGNAEKALINATKLNDIFGSGNFFLEIQDNIEPNGQKLTMDTADLAKRTGIPLVATNDVHYLSQDDAHAHQVLISIGEGRTVSENSRQFLKRHTFSAFHRRNVGSIWH